MGAVSAGQNPVYYPPLETMRMGTSERGSSYAMTSEMRIVGVEVVGTAEVAAAMIERDIGVLWSPTADADRDGRPGSTPY